MALQLRRGTNQQRLGLTPVEGEMIYVTDNILVTISVTSIDTGTETLSTSVEHGLILNQQVKYTGATLNGLTKDQVYYVKTTPTTTSFTLSTSSGGGTLNITGTYSVPLVFAKTPCNATGAPLGYDVSPLWAGDGTTVGGNPAGSILLDELRDVVITQPAVEGEFLWYNGTSWVNENQTTVDTRAKTLSLTRRSDSTGENYENEVALRLNDRLTDTNSYVNDEGGPAVSYERSSGVEYTKTYVSGGAIGAYTVTLNNVTNLVVGDRVTGTGLTNENPGALITNITGNQITLDKAFTVQASGNYSVGAPISFGHVAMEWNGTTNLHKFKVSTSTDGFLENPANTYPGTNTLIESTKNGTNINSGVLYVDKVNGRIGVNDTGPDYNITVYKDSNPNFALVNAEREFLLTNDAGNDQLSFAWGGGNRLQFNVTNNIQSFPVGRLGIANTSPTVELDVTGAAKISGDLTVDTNTLFVNASTNRVGILNTSPTVPLDVTGAAAISGNLTVGGDLTVTGTNISTGVANSAISVDVTTGVTNLPIAALTVKTTSTGTPAVGFGTAINFVGQTGVSNFENAGFIAVASTDITGTAEDFRMRFGLMENGTDYTTKMDLDSAGNLQIDGELEVTGNIIKKSSGTTVVTFSGTNLTTLAGDIALGGNTIRDSASTPAIELTGANVEVFGDLTVTGANIGTGVDDSILTIDRTTAGTSAEFRRALILKSASSGTPSVGYGTAMSFTGQTSSSNFEDAGYIAVKSTDHTPGSEDFKMHFGLMENGATYTDKMSLTSNGYLVASSATFGNIDIDTTNGQIDTNNGFDLTLDSDGGDVFVNDRLTVEVTLQCPSDDTVTSGAISIGTASTIFTTTNSNQTSTLAAGNDGQFKSLVRSGDTLGGQMVVTVTNAGWKTSGTGTITFGNIGDSCLLQYIGDKWYAVGSNDVVFA